MHNLHFNSSVTSVSIFKMATDVWRRPPLPFHDQFREFASFHFLHVTLQEGSPDVSGEETHASRLPRAWRARDKNCPLRHFIAPWHGSSPPAVRGTGKADPADRSMRQISPHAERRVLQLDTALTGSSGACTGCTGSASSFAWQPSDFNPDLRSDST